MATSRKVPEQPTSPQKAFSTNDNVPASVADLQEKIAKAMERNLPSAIQAPLDNNVPARSSFSSLAEAIRSNSEAQIPEEPEPIAPSLESYLKNGPTEIEAANENETVAAKDQEGKFEVAANDNLPSYAEQPQPERVSASSIEEMLQGLLDLLTPKKLEGLLNLHIDELEKVAAVLMWLKSKLEKMAKKAEIEEAAQIEMGDLETFAKEIRSLIAHAAETMNSSAGSAFANTLTMTLDQKLGQTLKKVEDRKAAAEQAIRDVGESGEMPTLEERPVAAVRTLITIGGRTEALGNTTNNPALIAAFTGGKIGNRFPINHIDALNKAA
jgi:hypothetical protein